MPINALNVSMDKAVWCIWATSNDLVHLKDLIDSGACRKLCSNAEPWGGADVIISDRPVPGTSKTVVVTEYWRELSWLFNMLKKYFDWHLDSQNKFDFYRCLADAANSCISETEGRIGRTQMKDERYMKDLLNRVVENAICVLDDLDRLV